jgi:MFS family permease
MVNPSADPQITQYPGGRLSHTFGAKWIISGGLLITGIISLILPVVTVQWGKTGLMILRVLQGLAEVNLYTVLLREALIV